MHRIHLLRKTTHIMCQVSLVVKYMLPLVAHDWNKLYHFPFYPFLFCIQTSILHSNNLISKKKLKKEGGDDPGSLN